jgi:NAD binding domain of 6-phosphogluconate dehydrogenase
MPGRRCRRGLGSGGIRCSAPARRNLVSVSSVHARCWSAHPGEMGASIGAALRRAGVEVLWVSAGRRPASRHRAQAADLTDAGTLPALVARSDLVVSVCPPHAAIQVARRVAALGFGGLYVDANAVAPTTARALGAVVERAGGRFVDGDLIGGPVRAGDPRGRRCVRGGCGAVGGVGTHAARPVRAFAGCGGHRAEGVAVRRGDGLRGSDRPLPLLRAARTAPPPGADLGCAGGGGNPGWPSGGGAGGLAQQGAGAAGGQVSPLCCAPPANRTATPSSCWSACCGRRAPIVANLAIPGH